MRLTSVSLQGFKSFGSKAELLFTPGITAVIGPNGSGKSNLAEAIRWVLGEQSLKQLRGKEREDIIFSGTGAQKALKAQVALTFSNESGRFPFDASEVTITRQLRRTGESEYLLNGEPVRLIDLQQMLAEAGIGTKSYTVISQGTVEKYITASVQTRKELFDEATGVKSLQIKLHKAEKKLKSTQEHALHIRTVLEELAPRLQVLERQVRRHEERTSLLVDFEGKQLNWFSHRWHSLQERLAQLSKNMEDITEQAARCTAEREALEQKLVRAAQSPTHNERQELEAKLREENRAFTLAQQQQERQKQERAHLEQLLTDVAKERQKAEELLAQSRTDSPYVSWVRHVRRLLQRSQELCATLLKSNPPTEDSILSFQQDIVEILEQSDDEGTARLAHSLFEQLERPLQQVARLQAIEKERERQLANLPVPTVPSRASIQAVEQQLQALSQDVSSVEDPSLYQQQLQVARQQELALERTRNFTEADLEAIKQAMRDLEQEVLRERGSGALESIQTHPLSSSAPTDEEMYALSQRLSQLGETDPLTLKEYEEVRERFIHFQQQLSDIEASEQNVVQLKKRLEETISTQFATQFSVIQQAFSQYFSHLFGGGKAFLQQTEDGIEIVVQPPNKRIRSVHLLSGGEKTLTSLALLLAILEIQVPPFIVFDEVDAALDEANSHRLASILEQKATSTQCIVISHNRQTMAKAQVLYGVMMQPDGSSKIYSVRMQDIIERSPQETAITV